ncbi:MAG TPA: hypothetical protein VKN99_20380 [Polyangia bacterium]|nr:hypothetical protein [Polyangia bacterium]
MPKWVVLPDGAHVLDEIGVILATRDRRWRAYTSQALGELSLGPFDTLAEAKAALEQIASRFHGDPARLRGA